MNKDRGRMRKRTKSNETNKRMENKAKMCLVKSRVKVASRSRLQLTAFDEHSYCSYTLFSQVSSVPSLFSSSFPLFVSPLQSSP